MALYSIESEQCLGMSHSGAVTVNGESAVELSDEEVDILVKLIKEKDTTDVEELELENLHPDIYKKLNDAYYKMAYEAEEMNWLWEGYYSGSFQYDTDELMEYCEKECGFTFNFKPEEHFNDTDLEEYKKNPESYEDEIHDIKCDAFYEWLSDYVEEELSDDDARDFFYNHMHADLDLDNIEYDVEIPQAIIKMTEQK